MSIRHLYVEAVRITCTLHISNNGALFLALPGVVFSLIPTNMATVNEQWTGEPYCALETAGAFEKLKGSNPAFQGCSGTTATRVAGVAVQVLVSLIGGTPTDVLVCAN